MLPQISSDTRIDAEKWFSVQERTRILELYFATVLVQRQSAVLVQRQFPIIYSDVPPQAEVVSSTPQVLAHAYEAEMMLSVRCTVWPVVCLQQSELR